LCRRLQIQHITTTAFHPCSNGMVERCHRQLKDANKTSYSRKPTTAETPAKLEPPAVARMLVTAEMFSSGWTPEEAGNSVQWEL
jgi:hypothetical protein